MNGLIIHDAIERPCGSGNEGKPSLTERKSKVVKVTPKLTLSGEVRESIAHRKQVEKGQERLHDVCNAIRSAKLVLSRNPGYVEAREVYRKTEELKADTIRKMTLLVLSRKTDYVEARKVYRKTKELKAGTTWKKYSKEIASGREREALDGNATQNVEMPGTEAKHG